MSTDPETTSIVRSWLRTDEHDSAARVLDDVIDLLDVTPQRRAAWSTGMFAHLDAYSRLAIAAAVVVIAVAAVNLAPRRDIHVGGPNAPALSPLPSTEGSPTPGPVHTEKSTRPVAGSIEPGAYDIEWPLGPTDARVHLTVPPGWSWLGTEGTLIHKSHGRFYGFPADLETHAVSSVVTSVCALEGSSGVGPIYRDVGPSVDDLTTAISNVTGAQWSAPADVIVDDYPAKRLELTYSPDCPGPGRRYLWHGNAGAFFVEAGVRSSVYVVDVDGERLVMTTHERTSSPDVIGELEAIVASIHIERGTDAGPTPTRPATPPGRFPTAVGPDADLRVGRHTAIVEGVPFSFTVPSPGWEPQLDFYISKSTTGPQDAEAILRWTTFPNGLHTDPCSNVLSESTERSVSDLATAVANAPGIDVVSGPSDVLVGGRAAKHVLLAVRERVGCDPGFFYTYVPVDGGALWTDTQPGDTIVVWIVEVDGKLLFIEGEMQPGAGEVVEQEIQQIVDSMQFE